MEEQFTLENLVSFGNYLLGEPRRHSVVSNPANGYAPTDGFVARGNGALNEVSDADVANWANERMVAAVNQIREFNASGVEFHSPGEEPLPVWTGPHRTERENEEGVPQTFHQELLAKQTEGPVVTIEELDQEKSDYNSSNSYLRDLAAEAPIASSENAESLESAEKAKPKAKKRRGGGGLVQTYPSLEEGPTFPDPEEPQEI